MIQCVHHSPFTINWKCVLHARVAHHRALWSFSPSSGSRGPHMTCSQSPRSQSRCSAQDELLRGRQGEWTNRRGNAHWIFNISTTSIQQYTTDLSVSSFRESLTRCRPVVSPNTGGYWGPMYIFFCHSALEYLAKSGHTLFYKPVKTQDTRPCVSSVPYNAKVSFPLFFINMFAVSVNSERVRTLLIFVSECQGIANRSSKSNRVKGHQVGFGKEKSAPSADEWRYCRLQWGRRHLLSCFRANRNSWIRGGGSCQGHDCWFHFGSMFYQVRAFGGSDQQVPRPHHLKHIQDSN